MCYLTARFVLTAALGNTGAQIVAGLPNAVATWNHTASAQTDIAGALVRISTTGTMTVYYGAAGIYNLAIAYPCDGGVGSIGVRVSQDPDTGSLYVM